MLKCQRRSITCVGKRRGSGKLIRVWQGYEGKKCVIQITIPQISGLRENVQVISIFMMCSLLVS